MDPFVILPQERARYVDQFNSLKPVGGFVSGDQAKGFLLQSQLPPVILGHIWYYFQILQCVLHKLLIYALLGNWLI